MVVLTLVAVTLILRRYLFNSFTTRSVLQALALNPSSGCAKSHIGFILKTSNKIAEAIPYLEEGIKSGEERAVYGTMYTHLGDAYNRLGKTESVSTEVYY